MKILVVGRKFGGVAGGVERMAIVLLNALYERGHEAQLLTWDVDGAEAYYPMDPGIRWHRLNMGDASVKASWKLRLARQVRMRALIKRQRPDVIVAFQLGPFVAIRLAVLGLGIPVVAAERNAPQRFDHTRVGRHRVLWFQTFRMASTITVQLESYRNEYPPYLRERIEVIPNPVQGADGSAAPEGLVGQQKALLCVARLTYQKNQGVLIGAFAKIADSFPDWRLRLVGDGDLREQFVRLARDRGIAERVDFAGDIKDVSAEYASAHLFCMPSLWEGFPNAVAEAMAHGLPVVGFADCAGINELIRPGENDLLAAGVFDADELAETLGLLMADAPLRREMGEKAKRISHAYRAEHIFPMWESLFERLARGRV